MNNDIKKEFDELEKILLFSNDSIKERMMLLRLKHAKHILNEAKWYEFLRKLRQLKEILNALNYYN